MKQQINEIRRMQQLAGIITENIQRIDQDTYLITYNGKEFEFSYQEYDDAYICLEPWSKDVAKLAKYLESQGVELIIDVAPEKTIIIKRDEFEKLINTL